MDYEKKYKEALEELRGLLEGIREEKREILEEDITSIFPELQENKDERIREGIILNLEYLMDRAEGFVKDELKERIAWLEKQGEQKQQGKSALEAINEEKVDNANKVEPKFTWSEKYICVAPNKEDYHLWNIKDAKDGDILQLGKVTAIFQNYISNKECRCYCSVFEGKFKIPIHYADTYGCHNAIPATKEQRDTLMKAMADAGYTFDFERKELKKISKKPTNSIWHDNKCIPDEDDTEILVEYNLNNSTRPNHLFHDVAPYDSSSKMFHCYSMHLKLEEIIRWAYMDDILQVVNR
jgi:hypothetical protein